MCQDKSLQSHHQFECLIQDTLYRAGLGAWLLAFRIVCSRSLSDWLGVKDDLENHNEDLGLSGEHEYSSKDTLTVFHLVTHDQSEKREAPVLMKECLAALFFLRCLQHKNYFGLQASVGTRTLTSDEMFITLLLHHFMRVVFYNCHEVTHLQPGDHWTSSKVIKIGVAINPSLALINHSCDPNYARGER